MANVPSDPVYTIDKGIYKVVFPDTRSVEFVKPQSLDRKIMTILGMDGKEIRHALVSVFDPMALEKLCNQAAMLNSGDVGVWVARMEVALAWLVKEFMSEDEDELETVRQSSTIPVEPFPISVFPRAIQNLIREASESLPCPPDFIGACVIGVLSQAIGTSYEIKVKPGWCEGCRVYIAIVADPGEKKSPALDIVMAPLYAYQKTLEERYEQKKLLYEVSLANYEVELAVWKEAIRKGRTNATTKPVAPILPTMAQVFAVDTTIEALGELLQHNPRGILLVQDELTAWALSMNQYRSGKGADRQHWLKIWAGAPTIINRKGKEPVSLPNPFVSVTGCLPPDVLSDLSDERGREEGFVHRILFTMPDRVRLTWTNKVVSDHTITQYHAMIQGLLADAPGPKRLRLTREALRRFITAVGVIHEQLNDVDCPANMRGPLGKMEGYVARLSLILQCARHAAGETPIIDFVEEESVIGAAALASYFMSHAKRVYGRLTCSAEDKRVDLAMRWILTHGNQASARDLVTNKVAGIKTSQDAEMLIELLAQRGFGTITRERKNRVAFIAHDDKL